MVNASRDQPKTTDAELQRKIHRLARLSVPELKRKYRETFGDEARVSHKEFLLRRLAWQMQATDHRNLSEHARRRIDEIADLSDIRPSGPPASRNAVPAPSIPIPMSSSMQVRDPRLPPVGSLLRRHHKGREIVVRVLEEGFEYDEQRYRSLSAIARHITGTNWNGLLFFNLTERRYA